MRFFLAKYAKANELIPTPTITSELEGLLRAHDWPGNVRELENTMERLVVLSEGDGLSTDLLNFNRPKVGGHDNGVTTDVPKLIRSLIRIGVQAPIPADMTLEKYIVGGVERELIEHVMRLCDNVQVKAAARLGINRNTLHKKLDEYERSEA